MPETVLENDATFMARAINLARNGWFTTHPNPRVGCVIVKDGSIVGEGWHVFAGQNHAEINALELAGKAASGATAYVTLEPCSHYGRTPPCCGALIKAGVGRVVVGMQDPNPLVAGRGIESMRSAGIEVTTGVLETQCAALNKGFIKRMAANKPYVRVKLAMSMDGRTAMSSGESKWITSSAARRDVQRLRAESSAIMTGIGTVLADNPSLDVREKPWSEQGRLPDRIVLDSSLQMPAEARMLDLPGKTLIYTLEATAEKHVQLLQKGAQITVLPTQGSVAQLIPLDLVMKDMAQAGYNEVLVEAGATLAGALLEQGLIDELVIYMAPHIMGNSARGLFHLPAIQEMNQRIEMEITDIRAVGKDFRITAILL